MATNFTVINKALALLGESSIADYVADDKAIKCGALYPTFSETMLSIYPWRFARKKSASLTATTAPAFGYTYAWTLPADLLTIINVYNSTDVQVTPQTKYERFGAVLHTEFTPCYVDYTEDLDEATWPSWYIDLVANAFAAEAAISITDDASKESFYRQKAFGTPSEDGEGGLYKVCKAIDSRQQPLKRIPGQSLLASRFSGGTGSR